MQSYGCEVIHLGHNRSVAEIVDAAIEEDVQGIAVSSYQGGHIEFFKYMVDLLKEYGAPHIKIFGGGGGVIVPEEIRELEACGVTRIYTPEDGAKMGLQGIINHMAETMDFPRVTDGAVGSRPNFTRTGRPSSSLSRRPSSGRRVSTRDVSMAIWSSVRPPYRV